jgi:quercetin dioxygenase-like cupin family protein
MDGTVILSSASISFGRREGDAMEAGRVVYTATDATAVSSPEKGMRRQVLAYSQQLMLVRHQFAQGWAGARHSHPHHQLVYVVRGHIRFEGGGKTVEMHGGDSLVVDGSVEHQATALEDSEVLDVFTPYREDYA